MVTNSKIFIINGKPTAGKDTFVSYVTEEAKDEFEVLNVSTVDKVKEAAVILGWNGIKTDSARLFLSELKDLSSKFFDGPAKYCYSVASSLKDNQILFIHCREPEEIDKMKKMLDCFTIYIDRTLEGQTTSNHADAEVTNYKYDYVIDNNSSLDDLRERAKMFLTIVKDQEKFWIDSKSLKCLIDKVFIKISNPTNSAYTECKAHQRLS